jgi:hypothetical protein
MKMALLSTAATSYLERVSLKAHSNALDGVVMSCFLRARFRR